MPGAIDWFPRARLYSGLVLFTYVTTHLLNHALGLASLEAMEAGRLVFLAVWRNPLGTLALYGALIVHLALVLYSLYRRRSLRMRPGEAVQTIVGLALPPLLVVHVVGTRGLHATHGVNDLYAYVLANTYVFEPEEGVKQAAAIVLAWTHGALGLHYWLRLKPWYRPASGVLLAVAVAVPLLALSGFLSAGREVAHLLQDPAWAAAFRARARLPDEAAVAWAFAARDAVLWTSLGLLLLTATARLVRVALERRKGIIAVTYPGERVVRIHPGMTVLEASRGAGLPHASVCGGRGRCSTCRVRVSAGGELLAPPSPEELKVLTRVGAPPGVRLACQIRPSADLEVLPLLPPGATAREGFRRGRHLEGAELEITIVFADLRAFTRFAERKLPFDVVFVINQYARAMGQAIEQSGGRVDKFIGDGVMALFGVDSGPEQGAKQALVAARAMAAAIDDLNRILANDLDEPLRLGIGIHAGPVIVGEMGYARALTVTAIGDAVNTASRLEALSKEFGCELVVSRDVALRAGVDLSAFPSREIEVRGRSEGLTVYVLDRAYRLPGDASAAAP